MTAIFMLGVVAYPWQLDADFAAMTAKVFDEA